MYTVVVIKQIETVETEMLLLPLIEVRLFWRLGVCILGSMTEYILAFGFDHL